MDENGSDLAREAQRNNAILRAQLRDARNDVVQWREIARSNQELFYLDEMGECLAVLQQIAEARRTGLEPDRGEEHWKTHVNWFLDAYEGAKHVRGQALGFHLSSLVCDLECGKQSPAGGTPRKEEKKPLAWHEIEIAFLSDERVEIRSRGNSTMTYNYGELGFQDRRNGIPSKAWIMLRSLAKSGGEMPQPPAGRGRAKAQKRIEEIREKLRSHFKIDGDPVPFNGSTYKTSFKISRGQSFDT